MQALHPLLLTKSIRNGLRKKVVGSWNLLEASGNRADSGPNGYTLTDNGTVTGNPGPSALIPTASQFTVANSEFLSKTDTALLSGGVGVRKYMCAWIYPDTAAAAAAQAIATKDDFNVASEFRWRVGTDAKVSIVLTAQDQVGAVALAGDNALSDATWYFVEWWYDGAFAYLGVNLLTKSAAYTADIADLGTDFAIGCTKAVVPLHFFGGRICGVNMLNQIPTYTERRWFYAGNLVYP